MQLCSTKQGFTFDIVLLQKCWCMWSNFSGPQGVLSKAYEVFSNVTKLTQIMLGLPTGQHLLAAHHNQELFLWEKKEIRK